MLIVKGQISCITSIQMQFCTILFRYGYFKTSDKLHKSYKGNALGIHISWLLFIPNICWLRIDQFKMLQLLLHVQLYWKFGIRLAAHLLDILCPFLFLRSGYLFNICWPTQSLMSWFAALLLTPIMSIHTVGPSEAHFLVKSIFKSL